LLPYWPSRWLAADPKVGIVVFHAFAVAEVLERNDLAGLCSAERGDDRELA
jgi:hypothetical protein